MWARFYPVVLLVSAPPALLQSLLAVFFSAARLSDGASAERPSLPLSWTDQPRLYLHVREMAQRMGVRVPDEIHLNARDVAAIALHGGLLGFGGSLILYVGVGELRELTVSQLDVALAHELGHVATGDSGLRPLKNRALIALDRVADAVAGLAAAWVRRPLQALLRAYWRVLYAIERERELFADAWSVWLLGLDAFLSMAELRQRNEDADAPPDEYDRHPRWARRISHAQRVVTDAEGIDTTPAAFLLNDLEALEQEMARLDPPEPELEA